MKISAINTNQNSQLHNNFTGIRIKPENLSDMDKSLIGRVKDLIIIAFTPIKKDVFIKEELIDGKRKNVLTILDPAEHKNEKNAIELILEEANDKFMSEINLEEMLNKFDELVKNRQVAVLKPDNNVVVDKKLYIPMKIGEPKKPYVKNQHINFRKNK